MAARSDHGVGCDQHADVALEGRLLAVDVVVAVVSHRSYYKLRLYYDCA